MGRELKRVPLDFDWPLNVAWKGYVSPYRWRDCPRCEGTGLNVKTKVLSEAWYHRQYDVPTAPDLRAIFMDNADFGRCLAQDECDNLAGEGRLYDLTNEWKKLSPDDEHPRRIRKLNADGTDYYPSAEQVNAWSRGGIGHDSINHSICVEFRAKKLGFHGHCALCKGDGCLWPSVEYKELAREWKEIDPPEGLGYQLWESEGSPISLVFPDEDSFVDYLVGEGSTQKAARKFVDVGVVPSMVMEDGQVRSNIETLERR